MFTKELIDTLAQELATVRHDNNNEGTAVFQATMNMIQSDERYDDVFNEVIRLANALS